MNKMIEYTIICSSASDYFSEKINEHLLDGWQLYGNTFYDDHTFYQPMTRILDRREAAKTP